MGGDCLNRGCVPTKVLIKSAKVASLMRRAPEFGLGSVPVEVDFPAVMRRMRRVIERAGEHDSAERFRSLGVDVLQGEQACFTGPRELSVGGRRLRGRSVIIATGSHPAALPVPGLRETGYLTNETVLELEEMPRSMVVVGSGPIGSEFAQMFARFGCRVELVSLSPNPLPVEEPEVGEALKSYLEADGVRFHGGFGVERVSRENGEKVVVVKHRYSGEVRELRGEEILVAAGRAPSVEGLGLGDAGVEVGEKGIRVDEHLATSAEGVYAAGDVTGILQFTHAAEYQGRISLTNALFPVKQKADYRSIPWTTFTDPEVARVGLTERQAREQNEPVEAFTFPFSDLDRALCDGETKGFVKLVTGRRGRLLGGHIIGPDAGNYIGEVALALKKGMKIGDLSQTVHVYPTLSESVKRAADAYYREKLFTSRNKKLLKTFFDLRRRLF